MGKVSLAKQDDSYYKGCCFILTTKHAKSIAIAPHFEKELGVGILEYVVDTDALGTFSGEVERKGSALECARAKCELAFNNLGEKVNFVIASEGSFGPHPMFPFMPCDHEILYMIDRIHDFHLHISHFSEKTNYRMQSIDSLDALREFALKALFPSHELILRPNDKVSSKSIYKGICTHEHLETAFLECKKSSSDAKVWVETDMRAHFNPTRMSVIGELGLKMAKQLKSLCPKCSTPGWGKVRQNQGLRCMDCGLETELTKSEIFCCRKCKHEQIFDIINIERMAEPKFCINCNP